MSKIHSLQSELTAAREAVTAQSSTDRTYFVNLAALRQLHAEKKTGLVFSISTHPAPNPLDVANGVGHICREAQHHAEFYTIDNALRFAESLPEAVAAEKLIGPLVAEVRRIEALIEAEEAVISAKRHELLAAKEAATAAALSKVEKDPAILKASAELAKLAEPELAEA
jgi:hypothetical protein